MDIPESKRSNREPPRKSVQQPPAKDGSESPLQPAEERGERLDTGKRIARGGKDSGHVPGAEESA